MSEEEIARLMGGELREGDYIITARGWLGNQRHGLAVYVIDNPIHGQMVIPVDDARPMGIAARRE